MLAAKGMPRQEQVWKLAVMAKEARGQEVAFLAHCIFSTRRTRFGAVTKVLSHSLGVLVLESTFWPSLIDSQEKEQLSVIQHKTLSKLSGNFVFNICLFEHQKDRQRRSAHPLSGSLPNDLNTTGWSRTKPRARTCTGCCTWAAGTQAPGLPSVPFPGVAAGSPTGSRAAGTWTCCWPPSVILHVGTASLVSFCETFPAEQF